jgi:hypothetical protein
LKIIQLIHLFLCFTSESGSFLVPVSPACEISEDFVALDLETEEKCCWTLPETQRAILPLSL